MNLKKNSRENDPDGGHQMQHEIGKTSFMEPYPHSFVCDIL